MEYLKFPASGGFSGPRQAGPPCKINLVKPARPGAFFEFHHTPARAEPTANPEPGIKTVLVPLTLSEQSSDALVFARKLAEEFGARLVLMHALQLNIGSEERGIPRARLLEGLLQEAETRLTALAATLGAACETEVIVCEGRPAYAILSAAERLEADVIVLHARHRPAWLKWLRPPIVVEVAQRATGNVMILASSGKSGAFDDLGQLRLK